MNKDLTEQELEIIHEAIHHMQNSLIHYRTVTGGYESYDSDEGETLDGDDVEAIVYEIREALNDINGNN